MDLRGSPAGGVERALARGLLDEAIARSGALLELPIGPDARAGLLAARGLALALRGSADEADRCFDLAAATPTTAPTRRRVLACRAEASMWVGLPGRALEQAMDAARIATTGREGQLAALTAAWAAHDLGRRPRGFRGSTEAPAPDGAEAELAGLFALADGSVIAAAAAFETATRRWEGRNLPRELVCRWAAGDARRRAGDPAATAALRSALHAASSIGFEPLVARIRRSLRLAGDRPARLPAVRDAGDCLTPRERQVLELVARGRTNSEIARRLGLGRPTVARLLSNAMLRLGAQRRAQAVVLAAEARAAVGLAEPRLPGREAISILARDAGAAADADADADAKAILALLANGHTLGDAAASLALSRRTADRRLAEARAALGVARTVEAVARARALGWLGREAAA